MPVTMAKTSSHATGSGKTGTKVPFKKVFSSSHLQTNGVNGGHANDSKSHLGRGSNDFGSALAHPNLTSQLSSSLPGFLDNVNNSNQAKRTPTVGPPELVPAGAGPRRSSQRSITSTSSGAAVIESLQKGAKGSVTMNIPFSAIEPSLIVSLSTYLNSLKNFDPEKLIKEIHLMLTYFEDVVKKDKLEQLVGACTILMDTVDANCAKLKSTYMQLQQVQLRLQLLLQSLDDETETLAKIQSSPVIEATNDLYRKMAELLQWSDQVSTIHRLIEDGDRRIQLNEGPPSPETASEQPPPPSREAAKMNNIKKANEVARNLLESFENLVKAYKGMENELRQCYDEYSHANKQMVDIILAESPANRSLHSIRRRSITPPPDYPLSSSGSSHRVPNGSTSTIASSTSSNSSTSSHFLGRRIFPTLTNHAQKMAHKMLSKKQKDSASPKADGASDKHSWSLWPLLGSNLRRSESASDISSLPRASYLDIPEENHGKGGSRNRSPSPFRKHSINEQIIANTNSSNSDSITLPSTPIRDKSSGSRKSSTSQVNRHSDGNTESGRTPPPPSLPFGVPAKEMLVNPLYFSTAQFQNANSQSADSLVQTPLNVPGSRTSPSSSPSSTHSKYSVESGRTNDSKLRILTEAAADKPPPLPPKTYQSRSMSSTRSSIASNTSSSSTSSKECHRPSLNNNNNNKDTDSGLGVTPASGSSSDLDGRNAAKCVSHGTSHYAQSSHANGCDHRRAICATQVVTCNHHCPRMAQPPTHHHCGCPLVGHQPSTGSNTQMEVNNSQVTLRPKKSRGRTHKCDYNCERAPSPPPLPPPDSILFSLDSVVPLDSGIKSCESHSPPTHCCCHSRGFVDERNKENYNTCNVNTCSCGQPILPPSGGHCTGTCQAHAPPPASHCSCHTRRQHVRTYRREHKTQSVQFTKAMRSMSIAETSSSTLKSSITSSSLTVDCSHSMTHSSSFPHRLSHSANSCDSGMPPPLPPKKRNMNAYMFLMSNYSGPSEPADFYRFSAVNLTNFSNCKSMIETKNLQSIRQNSTTSSTSAMSLSSSASSSSSLSTTASSTTSNAVTMVADHIDKQQYLHLPMAPPPPSHRRESVSSSPDKSPTPPPRLPPRRDKLNELPLAPPPPPPVSSSSVIQQRLQQQQQTQNAVNTAEQPAIITPRSSTPLKHSEVCAVQTGICSCHGGCLNKEESLEYGEEEEELSSEDVTEEVVEEEEDEEVPMLVEELEVPKEPRCCQICSDGTVHSQAECLLSQTDVPGRLLTYKTKDDEDDLGDLAIRAGTVDALLVKATQASATGADATFLHTFLNTYRSFLTPEQLIDKLIFRYNQFSANTEKTDIVRQAVAGKVVAFLVLAVNEFYLYDFSKALSHRLMEFIYQLVGRGDLAHAKCLREKCYEKLRARDREFAAAAATKLTNYNITTRTATLLDFKSEHIAEQMTLLDSRLFHKIEIPEILIWAKEQKEELIPNLNRFTEHFNNMSFWARSQILACEDQKEREKYYLKILKIMKYLKKLNNFNSYLSLLAALASAPISRLEWPKNIIETYNEYNLLIDSSSSFRAYRMVLANTKPPCIPYIGLILQDLTFVHIGNNDYLPDGKVNFAKHFKQFSILSQMKAFQQCKYSIHENEHIITFFDNFTNYLQEEVMWQISESIKPRGGGSNSINANAN